jgi:membrane protein implicated in regulation of membrane protease activity
MRRFADPVGKSAVVVEPITEHVCGRVRFQGTTWRARSLGACFQPGELGVIADLDNITIVLERQLN